MKQANITFISAGAGSGKTYRLTEILFDALRAERAVPAGVLATTFTRKAASELRERVRSKLLEEKAWTLASGMDAARIGTVNSVCGDLLTRFAFEAGISPNLQVMEEDQAASLLHQVMDETIDDAVRAELNDIAQRMGQLEEYKPKWPGEVLNLIQQARANGIEADRLIAMGIANADDFLGRFPKPQKRNWEVELENLLFSTLGQVELIQQTAQQKNIAGLINLYKEALRDLKTKRLAWSTWEKLSGADGGAKTCDLTQSVRDLAKLHLAHPGLHGDIRRYTELLFATASQIMAGFAAEKASQGLIDFTDQECLLLQILEHPEVEAVLQDELQLLLVDEFQDTSPIQLAIFSKLATLADETWWVGDLKQAIYGFRGSDPILMESVISAMPGLGGKLEVLKKSWRSRPALVDFINHLFTPVFAPQPSEQIRLSPARDEVLPDAAALACWKLAGGNKGAYQGALAHAIWELLQSGYQIVDKQTHLPRPLCAKDIAILSRSNAGVADVAAALSDVGIATSAGLPGLLKTPEAVLVLAALRRLNDETDTVATAEILSLAYSQEPEVWLADRLQWLANKDETIKPGQWREMGGEADPLLTRLAKLRGKLRGASPTEALSMAIFSLDAPRIVLGWQTDEQVARRRLANLEALQSLAQKYEDECQAGQRAATVSGLLFWLAEQAGSETDACATPDVDAVRVLTHHAAKGLEWPVVICLDLGSNNRSRLWGLSMVASKQFDFSLPLAGRSLRYWPWPYGDLKKVDSLDFIEQSEEAEAARLAAHKEGQRLLYVSLTRARDLLVFAVPAKQKGNGEWLGSLGENDFFLADQKRWPLSDGLSIPYQMQDCPETGHQLVATPVAEKASPPLHWFAPNQPVDRLPLIVNPSQAEAIQARVGQTLNIAAPPKVRGKVDRTELGIALHACFAAAESWPGLNANQVDAILKHHGVSAALDAADLARYIADWQAKIAAHWMPQSSLVEAPIQCRQGNGQQLEGQVDMLLKQAQGWVLIDHKTIVDQARDPGELVQDYSGQLAAYADAISKATDEKVSACWLHLPLSGVAVEVVFE